MTRTLACNLFAIRTLWFVLCTISTIFTVLSIHPITVHAQDCGLAETSDGNGGCRPKCDINEVYENNECRCPTENGFTIVEGFVYDSCVCPEGLEAVENQCVISDRLDVFKTAQTHKGKVATWGPVRRDFTGKIANNIPTQLNLVELDGEGKVARTITDTAGIEIRSYEEYKANVDRWFGAIETYENQHQRPPAMIPVINGSIGQCRNADDQLVQASIPPGVVRVLVRSKAGGVPDSDGPCASYVVATSTFSEIDRARTRVEANSMLVRKGDIIEEAPAPNFFTYKSGDTNQNAMSWAEYEAGSNRPVRIIRLDGEFAMSRQNYNAIVQGWLDAKADYIQRTGKTPQVYPISSYQQLGCLNGSTRQTAYVPAPGTRWVLVPDISYDETSTLEDIPDADLMHCKDLALAVSPWMDPAALLDNENLTSLLIDSQNGAVKEYAYNGNYFAIESGLFFPRRHAFDHKQCYFPDSSYTYEQLGPAAGTEADIFENCAIFTSITGGNTVWAPIQNVNFYVSSGWSVVPGNYYSDPLGNYKIPLSFPYVELLASVPLLRPVLTHAELQLDSSMPRHESLLAQANYILSAEIRYDSFNPRLPHAGYYTVVSTHGITGSLRNFSNYVVDATTLTVSAFMTKTPLLLGSEIVPLVGANFGVGGIAGQDFTEYDIQPFERGEVASPEGQVNNQGLLKQINVIDLTRTDTYIFRESSGALIGTRQGVSLSDVPAWDSGRPNSPTPEPGCSDGACLLYSVITRGPGSGPRKRLGYVLDGNSWEYNKNGEIVGGFNKADALTTEERARVGQFKQFVKIGDQTKVVLINRATGYMGTFQARVSNGPNGLPTYYQVGPNNDGTSPIARVELRPPNLRIKVRRVIKTGEDEKVVSADGAALASDQYLEITTEWYDEDGAPLPDDLPGFTGRLSRVADGELVAGSLGEILNDEAGLFAIRPGKHIVNIQLPTGTNFDRQHFYIHVSAAPYEELTNFSGGAAGDDPIDFRPNQVCQEIPDNQVVGNTVVSGTRWTCAVRPVRDDLVQRPALFVPFQVARFDRDYTEALAAQHAQQLADAWMEGDPLPVLNEEDIDTVYRWVYSPEMQFSIYDLDVKNVVVETTSTEDGNTHTSTTVDYDLESPDEEALPRPGYEYGEEEDSDGLYWGVGYDRVEAMVGEGQTTELASNITPEDYVGLDLFVDGDEANPLYELDHLALVYGSARPLYFERIMTTSTISEGEDSADYNDINEVLRVTLTREVKIRGYIESAGGVFTLDFLPSTRRDSGTYFIPVSVENIYDSGMDTSVRQEFKVIIEATNPDDPTHVHRVIYPSLFVERREDLGEGLSVDAIGKLQGASGADGSFDDMTYSATPEGTSAQSAGGVGGAALTDGSLRMQRDDFSVASIGPPLEFIRTYSNLESITTDSPMGIGWKHSSDIQLIPVSLEGESRQAVPNWFTELRSITKDDELDDKDLPEHWGEVIVKGIRFKGADGIWHAERGFQGVLIEQGDEFIFTDVNGTKYHFPMPRVPMPFKSSDEIDAELANAADTLDMAADTTPDDMADQGPSTLNVEVHSRLIQRIRAQDLEAPVTPGSPVLNPPLGKLTSSRPTRIVSPSGQKLVLTYDPVYKEQVTKVEDDFGRTLTFDYIDCNGGACDSTTSVKRRLSRVELKDSTSAVLQTAQFSYSSDGYLTYSNVQGRQEWYTYEEELQGSLEKNLTRVVQSRDTTNCDGVTSQDTTNTSCVVTEYTYFDEMSFQTFNVKGVPTRYYEVLSTLTHPRHNDEPLAQSIYRYGVRPSDGMLTREVKDPRGNTTTYILNAVGNPVEVEEPLGRKKYMHWASDDASRDTENFMVSVATSYNPDLGTVRRTRYGQRVDALRRVEAVWSCGPEELSESAVQGTPVSAIQCTESEADEYTEYDTRFALPTLRRDRNDREEHWTYNAEGQVISYIDSAGVETVSSYHTGETNPLKGLKIHDEVVGLWRVDYSYDSHGQLASSSRTVHRIPEMGSRVETSQTSYDSQGWLLSQTDALGHTWTYDYDERGYLKEVTFPELDNCPAGLTNPASVGAACQGIVKATMTHDHLGNKISEVDTRGLRMDYQYTARGQLTQVTRSSDNLSRFFRYDAQGNLLEESDWVADETASLERQNKLSYVYDELNRQTETLERLHDGSPDSFRAVTTHDIVGRPVEMRDFEGVVTYQEYDLLDRVVTTCTGEPCDVTENRTGPREAMTYYAGADPSVNLASRTVTRGYGQADVVTYYEWDDGYNLVKYTDGEGREHTWNYDALNMLTQEVMAEGETLEYTYDGLGRLWKKSQTAQSGDSTLTRTTEYKLDILGRAEDIFGPYRKPDGDLQRFTTVYDPWGRISQVKAYTGDIGVGPELVTHLAYDGRDELVWQQAADGGTQSFVRDVLGRMVDVRGAEGEHRIMAYDAQSRVIEQVVEGDTQYNTPDSRVCYEYNAYGAMIAQHVGVQGSCQTPANSSEVQTWQALELNQMGLVMRSQDAHGRIMTYAYDSAYRTVSSQVTGEVDGSPVTLPAQTVEYTADGLPVAQVDVLGNRTEFDYDRINRMTRVEVIGANPNPVNYVETWDHSVNHRTAHIDREGVETEQLFDHFDNLLQVTFAGAVRFKARYNEVGQVVQQENGRGHVTQIAYNDRGLPETITLPEVDGVSVTSQSFYDEMDRPVRMLDELGYELALEYDLSSRRTHSTYRGERTSMIYDRKGQVVEVITPKSQSIQTGAGQPTAFAGQTTQYQYDAFGRLVVVDEVGLVTSYKYNKINQLSEATGPGLQHQDYTYDGLGRMTQHQVAYCNLDAQNLCEGGQPEYLTQIWRGHDAAGNPTEHVDAMGQVFHYTYDGWGRMKDVTYPTRASQPMDTPRPLTGTMTYDNFHRPVSVALNKRWPGNINTQQTRTLAYDAEGRLDHLTQHHAWLESGSLQTQTTQHDYAYDVDSNLVCFATDGLTGCDNPGNASTRYAYDARDRLLSTTVHDQATTYQYDAASRLTDILYPNGTTTRLAYHDQDSDNVDNTTRLQSLIHGQGLSPQITLLYDYWHGGQLKHEHRDVEGQPLETRDMTYDALDRLLSSEVSKAGLPTLTEYTYADYNRSTEKVYESGTLTHDRSYEYNRADRLLSIIDSSEQSRDDLEWDLNGNLLEWTQPDEERTYGYNALDQLVEATRGPPGNLALDARYDYDPAGLRFFEQEGSQIRIHDWDASGQRVQSWLPGLADPQRTHYSMGGLFALASDGELGYFHTDRQGSILGLTNTLGDLIGQRRFDPFGQPLHDPFQPGNALAAHTYGYTGHIQDASTSLTYMKARYYAPELGVFLSNDPAQGRLSDPRSRHKHLYAHANPINGVDPDGRSTRFIGQHSNTFGSLPGSYSRSDAFANLEYTGFNYAQANFFQDQVRQVADSTRRQLVDMYELYRQQLPPTTALFASGLGIHKDTVNTILNYSTGGMSRTDFVIQMSIEVLSGGVAGKALSILGKVGKIGLRAGLRTGRAFGGAVSRLAMPVRRAMGITASSTRNVLRSAGQVAVAGGRKLAANLGKRTQTLRHKAGALKERIAQKFGRPRCRNSFTRDTPVLMCDGTTRPISELSEGESVLAKDPETGELSCQPVTKVHTHYSEQLVDITMESGEVVRATWMHPFLRPDGSEIVAGLLQSGDVVGGLDEPVAVQSVEEIDVSDDVFNLTVANAHTFFVGNDDIWVHNCPTTVWDGKNVEEHMKNSIDNHLNETHFNSYLGQVYNSDGVRQQYIEHAANLAILQRNSTIAVGMRIDSITGRRQWYAGIQAGDKAKGLKRRVFNEEQIDYMNRHSIIYTEHPVDVVNKGGFSHAEQSLFFAADGNVQNMPVLALNDRGGIIAPIGHCSNCTPWMNEVGMLPMGGTKKQGQRLLRYYNDNRPLNFSSMNRHEQLERIELWNSIR